MGKSASKSENKEENVKTSKTKLIGKENGIRKQQNETDIDVKSRINSIQVKEIAQHTQQALSLARCTDDDKVSRRNSLESDDVRDDVSVQCNRSFNRRYDQFTVERQPAEVNRKLAYQHGGEDQRSHQFLDTHNVNYTLFSKEYDKLDGDSYGLPGAMNRKPDIQPVIVAQPSQLFLDTENIKNTKLPSLKNKKGNKKKKKKKLQQLESLGRLGARSKERPVLNDVDPLDTWAEERPVLNDVNRLGAGSKERPVLGDVDTLGTGKDWSLLSDTDDHTNDELELEIEKLEKEKRLLEFQVNVMTVKTSRLETLCRKGEQQFAEEEDKAYVCPEKFLISVNFVQSHIAKLNWEIRRLTKERNDYLDRLSAVAGSRLTDNNPHITNLNDPNRPMKIAEQYSEIYDNDWTDALQDLQKQLKHIVGDDEIYVYHLYSLIKAVYRSCEKKSKLQINGLAVNMFLMNNPSTDQLDAMWQNYSSERQKINEGRKHTADIAIQMLQQTLITDAIFLQELRCCEPALDDAILNVLFAHKYFEKCVEVCWQMVIQDPPMYLETVSLEGTQIDKDSYRLYTTSGFKVKYAVWPALYLHFQGHKGPLMAKGVVQTEKIITNSDTEKKIFV